MDNTDNSIDIYERLATALEALPHGFARTKSGDGPKTDRDGIHSRGGRSCRPADRLRL